MKKALLFFILLSSVKIYSQQTVKDSVIYLEEVVVTQKAKKHKIIKVKTNGTTVSGTGMQKLPEQVSLLKNIPEGYLSYITFEFNSGIINLFKKETGIEYKDTELSLAIYAVAEDGTPAEKLTETEVRFVVKAEHRGTIKLDLKPLNIPSQPQLFFGIKSLSKEEGKSMVLKLQQNKDAISYTMGKDGKWYKWDYGTESIQIKMEAGVQVD